MMSRRRGFTLIELLVVISIIAILAAMLFPVFARARESARKIQCLSNVKNIAMAFQIYLTDYDKLSPSEHRPEVLNYFKSYFNRPCLCTHAACVAVANPYLKLPVVLDEYIKNRDVWKCPNATYVHTVTINSGLVNNEHVIDWFREMVDSASMCPTVKPCNAPFPPGWGGQVTDTITMGWNGCPTPGTGGFDQSIAVYAPNYDLSTSQITDPSRWVVCGDGGIEVEGAAQHTSILAYPEMCRLDGNGCSPICGGDWDNCSWTRSCSALRQTAGGNGEGALDPTWRKNNGHPRHLGGSNVGFADGHARWMSAEAILFGGGLNWSGYADGTNQLANLAVCITPAKTNAYNGK